MRRRVRGLRAAAIAATALMALAAAFAAGYLVGRGERGPRLRVLSVMRGTGNPRTSGTRYYFFDVNKPEDAARLRDMVRGLKASGSTYSIDDDFVEHTLFPWPDDARTNTRR